MSAGDTGNKAVLQKIFNPSSIAVIGASRKPGTIGNQTLANLIDGGFEGQIFAVNPGADEILGVRCYPSIMDVPESVDIAVFCVPARAVLDVARQCAQKGVKGFVVISSGFAEVGNRKDEEELVRIAQEAGARVLGPNIVGILVNSSKINASFAPCLPYPGKTALISQSGALLIALDMASFPLKIGMSAMISNGNMSDINFSDAIQYYSTDKNTGSIALYIEGLKNGRRFIEEGRRAGKPIIALKAGVSAHGAAAAASHTGSLAGSAKVYEGAFRQAHVLPAKDLDDLLDKSQALSMVAPLRGDNILVVTNGGGIGVLATDSAEGYGLPLQSAPRELQDLMRQHMPDFGSPKNPVDITGQAGLAGYRGAIIDGLNHPWVDGMVVLYCETAVTNPMEIADTVIKAIADSKVTDKPIVASFVGGEGVNEARSKMLDAGIPLYFNPDKAMAAMAALRQVARFNDEGPQTDFSRYDVDLDAARAIIAGARADGRSSLSEFEAKKLFALYGLPVDQPYVATSEDDVKKLAGDIEFPLVMKIMSPDIIHKSDAGGVKLNIKSEAEALDAYRTILANAKNYKADAHILGVLMEHMAPYGTEVICGSVNDPVFGPTVMFGLGGIFVEVLKDVTFRVAPIGPATAKGMMREIQAYPILEGVRGAQRRDQEALADVLSRVSQLVDDLGDEIAETDANPVMLYEEGRGVKVVDARVILQSR